MMSVQQAEDFHQSLISHIENTPYPVLEIGLVLNSLKNKTQETAKKLYQLQQGQQQCFLMYYKSNADVARFQHMSSNPVIVGKLWQEKEVLRRKTAYLLHLRIQIIEEHQKTFVELSEILKRILDTELISWKHGQQLAGNGVPFENNLDQIQEWCESLAGIIWQNCQQIREMETLCSKCHSKIAPETLLKVRKLHIEIKLLFSSLIKNSFIIENQPPQVMRKNTKFTAKLRLLVGSVLGVFVTPPEVKVRIISDAQAMALSKNASIGPEVIGDILNNLEIMEYHQDTKQMSVSFLNMQLTNITRAKKKHTESVMDEKFYILFQSQFKVGGGELVFEVFALSLPVVVTVHGNQEPRAWGRKTWYNSFAKPGQVPFQVPEKVAWKKAAEMLSMVFKDATGRDLTPDDLQFFACKIFGNAKIHDNSLCLTLSQFCRESLPGHSFTFCEWLYAIMKVICEHLRNLWNDGLIQGFVSRQQAEGMLLKRCNGTFLLRFSDSVLGGVSIAFVTNSQQGKSEVVMVLPSTSKDFAVRSLADTINDFESLLFLYPDVSKDQAFGKHYTPYKENHPPCHNNYVKPVLVTRLPVYGRALNSWPGIPQFMQSPDSGHHDSSNSRDLQAGSQYQEVVDWLTDNLSPCNIADVNNLLQFKEGKQLCNICTKQIQN